ncbi:MAG: hypothetical protein JKX73_11435 [Flavobacteriales bacterium]|nr:hypothetical protein [Flavobacteriales bacterium]
MFQACIGCGISKENIEKSIDEIEAFANSVDSLGKERAILLQSFEKATDDSTIVEIRKEKAAAISAASDALCSYIEEVQIDLIATIDGLDPYVKDPVRDRLRKPRGIEDKSMVYLCDNMMLNEPRASNIRKLVISLRELASASINPKDEQLIDEIHRLLNTDEFPPSDEYEYAMS